MAGETPHTVKRSKAATNVLILVSGIAVTAIVARVAFGSHHRSLNVGEIRALGAADRPRGNAAAVETAAYCPIPSRSAVTRASVAAAEVTDTLLLRGQSTLPDSGRSALCEGAGGNIRLPSAKR
jgi:hypothetical protein